MVKFKQRFIATFRELHINNNYIEYTLHIESTSRNGAIKHACKHAKESGNIFISLD